MPLQDREAHREYCRQYHSRKMLDPDACERLRKQARDNYAKACATTDRRERMNAYQRAKRADPDYRQKLIEQRQARRADPEILARERAQDRARARTIDGKAKQLLSAARQRAKKDGVRYSLSLDFVRRALLVGVCPRTGFKFSLDPKQKGLRNPFSPSLDRITPGGNYTEENVQIVCVMYNVAKSANTDAALLDMCKAVLLTAGYQVAALPAR